MTLNPSSFIRRRITFSETLRGSDPSPPHSQDLPDPLRAKGGPTLLKDGSDALPQLQMRVRAQQGILGVVVRASADRKLLTETYNGILLTKCADELGLLRIGQFLAIDAWIFFSSSTVWARMSLSISSAALAFSSSMQRRLSSSTSSGRSSGLVCCVAMSSLLSTALGSRRGPPAFLQIL